MERKIGEIFEYNGEWYQCIKGERCIDCDFLHENGTCIIYANYLKSKMGNCNGRTDNQNVVFKKLEKVGEPYEFDGHLFQSYRTFEVPIFTENYATVREFGNNSKISIKIKQNKEDMKEKKIQHYDCFFDKKPTLKEFDINLAKQGKPVCTRDGRKARIICFDRKSETPIIALVTEIDGIESIYSYHNNGMWYNPENTDGCDLMMLPEKKEGWVNVYKEDDSYTTSEDIYESKEEAIKSNPYEEAYLTTVKIEWEE